MSTARTGPGWEALLASTRAGEHGAQLFRDAYEAGQKDAETCIDAALVERWLEAFRATLPRCESLTVGVSPITQRWVVVATTTEGGDRAGYGPTLEEAIAKAREAYLKMVGGA